jgi:hypothetical protein
MMYNLNRKGLKRENREGRKVLSFVLFAKSLRALCLKI